ncbi:condensation protein [Okeania hirsuta]|uniref:Condensation protein n=1 Tax=Okeania hirsuta TaxID=1458930 RepID=A0A3N6PL63_9CYAN|nr:MULTISPECIES: condensation domain-containing protein [Okeania]NET75550.1 condensation protein [Okeania sp. SIO1F9]RQH28820.1 condensation protein [Okeania hirsuta]
MKSFSRKLGLVEKFMTLGHEVGGGLIVNVVYLEGFLAPDTVKQALKLVQNRHPILQVYIVECEDEFYFKSEGITEIPLQVLYKQDDNEAIKFAETELHKQFENGKNPLCRLTILYPDYYHNSCEIVMTFHHGIVDGISCMQFIDELVCYCQQITDGENVSTVESLKLLPPAEDLLNYKIINEKAIESHQLTKEKQTIVPQLIIEQEASANERFTRMLPRMLSQEKTKMLIKKCKQEETTVHSAICTAMLLASAKLLSIDNQVNFSYGFPVNLRKYCEPEITNENLGCFISVLAFNQLIHQNTFFWDLARECKAKTHDALISGVHINLLKQGKLREKQSLNFERERMIQSRLSQENTMGRNNLFSISNRGKFKLCYKGDKLKIKELYFAIGQHLRGDCFWSGVVTFNDQLFCNFIYVEPLISKKTAQLLADNVIMLLEKVCINQNLTLAMLHD